MKRVLIVNDCGLFWPSGMVRAMQYKPNFETSLEWQAEFTSRHSELITRLNYEQRLWARILLKPFRSLIAKYNYEWEKKQEDKIVQMANNYDLVYIVKSMGFSLYHRLIALKGPRIIIDINDAVWLPSFGWNDLPETLAVVDGVVCENNYVANYAQKYNSKVFVIPDSPQIELFDHFRGKVKPNPQRITLGWIGGSQNLGPLFQIYEPLEALFKKYSHLHLRIVGADYSKLTRFKHVRYTCRPSFNQEQMVEEVFGFDIGLFPLYHNDDGLARGTLKAMVYMSGEASIVAENYGENPSLINDGVNGFLASSNKEWYDKLEFLITNPTQRLRMAEQGLKTIRQEFTRNHIFAKLVGIFKILC